MAKLVGELMRKPITLPSSASVTEAARTMRSANIGTVIVQDDDGPCGIVTDRDIAVRAVADGCDPLLTPLSDICSSTLTTLSPDDRIERAIQIMRDKAIRRILVVDDDRHAVGVISLGDLAIERDRASVLGEISAAPPTI